ELDHPVPASRSACARCRPRQCRAPGSGAPPPRQESKMSPSLALASRSSAMARRRRTATTPDGEQKKMAPTARSGPVFRQYSLEAVQDLIGPEALEPVQRLVQRAELVGVDAAH